MIALARSMLSRLCSRFDGSSRPVVSPQLRPPETNTGRPVLFPAVNQLGGALLRLGTLGDVVQDPIDPGRIPRGDGLEQFPGRVENRRG
jgi:hypothetical protein